MHDRIRLFKAITDLGEDPTSPRAQRILQGATSHKLTAEEIRAVRRIWPKFPVTFKLEVSNGDP